MPGFLHLYEYTANFKEKMFALKRTSPQLTSQLKVYAYNMKNAIGVMWMEDKSLRLFDRNLLEIGIIQIPIVPPLDLNSASKLLDQHSISLASTKNDALLITFFNSVDRRLFSLDLCGRIAAISDPLDASISFVCPAPESALIEGKENELLMWLFIDPKRGTSESKLAGIPFA